jgi:hypothetical protein
MRLLIALAAWTVAVAGAAGVSSVVAKSIHTKPAGATIAGGGSSGSGSSGGSSGIGSSGGGTADPSSIKATDQSSLFRTANLARALAAARSQLGATARVDDFALYPGYLAITAVKGGSGVDFYIDANGRSTRTATGGAAGPAGSRFSLARVKADVPAALARRIATAGGVPESRLHYMVAETDPVSNRFRWLVYTVQGSRVESFQAPGKTGPLLEYRANSSTGLQRIAR